MTNNNIFDETFPENKQVGGTHYKTFKIQPYKFISENNLSFFQGNIIKYVLRYPHKGGIEDLEKVKHYCDLEILKIKNYKMKGKK